VRQFNRWAHALLVRIQPLGVEKLPHRKKWQWTGLVPHRRRLGYGGWIQRSLERFLIERHHRLPGHQPCRGGRGRHCETAVLPQPTARPIRRQLVTPPNR